MSEPIELARDAAPDDDGSTGHRAVDSALRAVAEAADAAPADQVAGFEAAHRVLRETLAGIDQE